jgi:hypothetical protein
MNVTLNKEAIAADCSNAGGGSSCRPRYIGPVSAPNLGVEIAE